MSSIDMFDMRNRVVAIRAGDFYERPGLFSPLRRCQLAYGVLYGLSKVGLRLRGRGLNLAFHQHPLNRQVRTNLQRAPHRHRESSEAIKRWAKATHCSNRGLA
jgi:hypothetical protein